jgi:flavin reductase (DIM6/NTAB) family NADH-FMN oxidoreductase RutF
MSDAVDGALGRADPRRAVGVAPDEFRHVMARFATGVTVVTCRQDGFDHAIKANSFTSV